MGLFGAAAGVFGSGGGSGSGNLAGLFGGAASGNLNEAQVTQLEKLAGRGGILKPVAQKFLNKYQASQASQQAGAVPSVVGTAGAANMSSRIESIESRLQNLEGGNSNTAATAGVAPQEPLLGALKQNPAFEYGGNYDNSNGSLASSFAVNQARLANYEANGNIPLAAKHAVGAPLMFKDQTGDGKITRADVIKARIEGYKK